jgi:hypothetical protein
MRSIACAFMCINSPPAADSLLSPGMGRILGAVSFSATPSSLTSQTLFAHTCLAQTHVRCKSGAIKLINSTYNEMWQYDMPAVTPGP